MNSRRRAALVVATIAALLAPAAHAMGNAQDCQPEDLAPVDAWLARHPWRVGYTQSDAQVAAACKTSPVDQDLLLVAAAYAQDREWNKNVVVAIVDTKRNAVRAAWKGVVVEQAFLRVDPGSLRLDTSRYNLAAGVRAFGVDLTSSVVPTCGQGHPVWYRSLFVQDGDALRPVVNGLLIESLKAVDGSTCQGKGTAAAVEPATASATIALSPRATNGFADLVVTETLKPPRDTPRTTARHELRYDGATYRRVDGAPIAPVLTPETEPTR